MTRKILVIHTWGLGDMIMFTPALRAIRQKYPDAEIDFLVTQSAATHPIKYSNLCNNIIQSKNQPIFMILEAMKLRANAYDVSIVTSGVSPTKGSLFSGIVGAKQRLGEYRDRKMKSYTDQVLLDPVLHRSLSNMKLIEPLVGNVEPGKPFFSLRDEDIASVEKLIRSNGWHGKKLFAIHAGSNKENDFKRWPADYFVEIALALKKKLPATIVYVISGPDEMDVSQHIHREADIPLVSGIKLSEVAALLSRSAYLLNSDSGLGHIASCFDTRIYTIFGPADERVASPFTDNKVILTADPVPSCKPCLRLKERSCNRECLLNLRPDMVLDKIVEDIGIE